MLPSIRSDGKKIQGSLFADYKHRVTIPKARLLPTLAYIQRIPPPPKKARKELARVTHTDTSHHKRWRCQRHGAAQCLLTLGVKKEQ